MIAMTGWWAESLDAKGAFLPHFRGVVSRMREIMSKQCGAVGELKECVGCEIERNMDKGSVKLTQPALMQSCSNEFDLLRGETDPQNKGDTSKT
jgi:hypothetical protein